MRDKKSEPLLTHDAAGPRLFLGIEALRSLSMTDLKKERKKRRRKRYEERRWKEKKGKKEQEEETKDIPGR